MRLLRAAGDVVKAPDDLVKLRAHVSVHLKSLHEERRTLDERAFYPAHDKRTESSAYTRTRRVMVTTEDQACRICGVRESTLRSKVHNVYGARAMETHHHVIEWAQANAIDVDRFNASVVATLRTRPEHVGD